MFNFDFSFSAFWFAFNSCLFDFNSFLFSWSDFNLSLPRFDFNLSLFSRFNFDSFLFLWFYSDSLSFSRFDFNSLLLFRPAFIFADSDVVSVLENAIESLSNLEKFCFQRLNNIFQRLNSEAASNLIQGLYNNIIILLCQWFLSETDVLIANLFTRFIIVIFSKSSLFRNLQAVFFISAFIHFTCGAFFCKQMYKHSKTTRCRKIFRQCIYVIDRDTSIFCFWLFTQEGIYIIMKRLLIKKLLIFRFVLNITSQFHFITIMIASHLNLHLNWLFRIFWLCQLMYAIFFLSDRIWIFLNCFFFLTLNFRIKTIRFRYNLRFDFLIWICFMFYLLIACCLLFLVGFFFDATNSIEVMIKFK